MARAIAYDLTRLFLGPLSVSPRGIDRVDVALAEHFFADAATPNLGILPTPWGVRCISAAHVRRGLDSLNRLWTERICDDNDLQLGGLITRIVGARAALPNPPPNPPAGQSKWARMASHLRATGFTLGSPVRSALPKGSIYLNIGQIGLAVPLFHNWLGERRDVTCAMMLHDAIPLEYPQFVEPASVAHHARMIRTAARHADALIMTTQHARDSVMAAMNRLHRPQVATCVRALPLPAAFAVPRQSCPELAGASYFVACATIEPRKNLTLLLRVWERLTADLGHAAPHLVIVGSRGWNAAEILAPIAEKPLLRDRVVHVSGLSSPALARLMLGANAILCPSLAEGFGLPVLEANALGVPTIASDIAAHREVADATTCLLPTDDTEAWERAVRSHPPCGLRRSPAVPVLATEARYCSDIATFLFECAGQALPDKRMGYHPVPSDQVKSGDTK